MANQISVEVVCLTTDRQFCESARVPMGATIHQVLNHINFFALFPEFTVQTIDVGIFSKRKRLSDVVRDNDRIEIYRPLLCDPKAARRERS